jgi:phasin family protein
MVADTIAQTETAAAKTVKTEADAVAETTKTPAKAAERAGKATRKTAKKTRREAKATRAKAQARAKERTDDMTFDPTNIFAGFGAFPGASGLDKLFAETAERNEQAVKRSRKAAEELADLYRGNVDAFVEAGRIAAAGAQAIGQDLVAKSRDSLEQNANNVRTFAEAKSAAELLQLQSEFARNAFDRFVEESSTMTESVVKLAGEAFQPISNRASANVEKLNTIAA